MIDPAPSAPQTTLVLGLGNVLMGDEGVGVAVVRQLEQHSLPAGVECLDGGTGGLVLLEPLQRADRIILIDAAADDTTPGTITRTTPRFSSDFPPTLTAHDIGVKDLLDVLYIQGGVREIILYAITIDPRQTIAMRLSEPIAAAASRVVDQILAELRPVLGPEMPPELLPNHDAANRLCVPVDLPL